MPRYEVPLNLEVTADHGRYLTDSGNHLDATQLRVRHHGDTLTAKWPPKNGFDNPPRFTGQIRKSPTGLIANGSIRESLASTMWYRSMRLATLFMMACALFGAILLVTNGPHYGLPPLLIGVVASLVFAMQWRGFLRQRKPNFDSAAEALKLGLTRYLAAGDDPPLT